MYVVSNSKSSLFFEAELYFNVFTYHTLFSESSTDGQLGCFYILVTINNTPVNTGVRVSFLALVFQGYMPNSGTAGSYGGFIPSFFCVCVF